MPLYEYLCNKCGNRFEELQGHSETEVKVECPNCESENVSRVFSTFSTGAGSAGCGGSDSGGWSFG
jgi:putative FmdB family regulatory protein